MKLGSGRRSFSNAGSGKSLQLTVVLVGLVVIGLLGSQTRAEGNGWNQESDTMKGALGLHAGKIGGVGLAYKYPLQWWAYFQAAGGIWHTSKHKRHNVGFELQYLLRQDSTKRLYLAAGVGYFSHKELIEPVVGDEEYSHSKTWFTGFGVGMEFLRSDRISIQIEGDFTHDSGNGDFIFFPQAGVFFYW